MLIQKIWIGDGYYSVSANYCKKGIKVNVKNYECNISDTAGSEKFSALINKNIDINKITNIKNNINNNIFYNNILINKEEINKCF